MIVETSVLVAIINLEPEGPHVAAALESSPANRISALTYLEASIVIDRSRDPLVSRRFDDLLAQVAIAIEPVTPAPARHTAISEKAAGMRPV